MTRLVTPPLDPTRHVTRTFASSSCSHSPATRGISRFSPRLRCAQTRHQSSHSGRLGFRTRGTSSSVTSSCRRSPSSAATSRAPPRHWGWSGVISTARCGRSGSGRRARGAGIGEGRSPASGGSSGCAPATSIGHFERLTPPPPGRGAVRNARRAGAADEAVIGGVGTRVSDPS